ncbi:V/A-type H+/Na+-transporting ATPase subunit E [Candidatus Hakubella thermalkaliphila]|uniref:V-type proton ATPase subunit E n=1 Tax=Candidatus Hakubella thermalkaliphila TaxID=2754717 RepID=A0A6V8PYZ6_9ACTN|nr:V-type ATP synthase subunit E family protein [Candidatus Hakubella thermalkaliphila]GFP19640.1 V/A-type H+/Na+-transporting ATPase subunit E [Candidatus Hakubella thermalkaliphila]GFP31011.1 V/A-type H+/Na+-transporting ATPase subunit E [Candidatus Hakubella thermalkaliphila]GFP37728.1 V/A-type H+/Na+-transporting ATPase subunit E [Candidatus Hakubella thermalkaliphila]GFP41039.1 V/A-type H+/Na+-transporting ATPase subunit E [Candidatus Hakubella thermalkaliphila]
MSFEKIKEKIISDAQRKVEEILKEVHGLAKSIRDEAETEGNRRKKEIVSRALQRAEEEKKRIGAVARLESRNSILREKRKLVERVFDEATERFIRLPEDEYIDFCKKLLLKATASGKGELILSARDQERIGKRLVEEINRVLYQLGKDGGIELSDETRKIRGGFYLREEGSDVNATLEIFIDYNREKLEREVITLLGGEGEEA